MHLISFSPRFRYLATTFFFHLVFTKILSTPVTLFFCRPISRPSTLLPFLGPLLPATLAFRIPSNHAFPHRFLF